MIKSSQYLVIKFISIAILFSCLSNTVSANLNNNQFIQQYWGEEQGLPVGDINGMVQDSQGYIWLASLDGLIRFDGDEFTQFDTSNSGVTSNSFTTIRKTNNDDLWLSTDEGELIHFKHSTATPIILTDKLPYTRVVRVTPRENNNIAYGTTNGVILIRNEKIIGLPIEKVSGDVKAINWPKTDSLWVATNSWLYHVKNPLGNLTVEKWPHNFKINTIAIYNNQVLIGTQNGMFQFIGESFTQLFPNKIKSAVFKLRHLPTKGILIGTNKLYKLDDNELTVISDFNNDNGFRVSLSVTNEQQQTLFLGDKNLWFNGEIIAKFKSNITNMIQEKAGGFLIATQKHGLYQLKQSHVRVIGKKEGLINENIYPLLPINQQEIILAGHFGASVISNKGDIIKHIEHKSMIASMSKIDNTIWLVGDQICILNQEYKCHLLELKQFGNIAPFSLVYQDKKGQIWLAGIYGNMWVKKNEIWHKLSSAQNNWTANTDVQAVLELDDGDILFGTNGNGIFRLRDNQVIDGSSHWNLPSRRIRSLLMINENQLLVGTQDKGLCRVDLSNKTSNCIDKTHNLPSKTQHYLFKDKKQRLWWSSNRGVFWQKLSSLMDVFDGKLQKLPNGGRYDKNNGMRDSEANGRAFPSGFVDENDRMWIPTQQGVAIFDTNNSETIPPASAVIQGLFLEGSSSNIINNPATFESSQRSFQVKLTALSFYNPKSIEFRYRETSNNLQNHWIELENNRLVNITHLSSGDHHFEFSARNTEGQWQENPAVIDINIGYLWYEKRFVQLIGLLLLFALIAAYIRIRNNKILQRSLVLEQMVKDRTVELKQLSDKRTDFFANISHELRTPLTLILGPIDDALIQKTPLDLDELKSINQSAHRMKRLVDQMLDLQKLDAGKLRLHKSNQQLLYFLKACIEPFTVLAKIMDIRMIIDDQSAKQYSDIWVSIDVEQMEKVMANLLSNAVKFSPKNSTITIKINKQGNNIAIHVLDQGSGIPKGANERIFNRFSQETSDQYKSHQGTGIGLALVKEVVKLHGGEVKANNRKKGGACFTLTLPIIKQLHEENQRTKQTNFKTKHASDLIYLEKNKTTTRQTIDHKEVKNIENATVLIVEDNKDLKKYIASHLQKQFEILIAGDGQQGLKMAQTHMPDIIVSDVMMPNMDGFEMAKALRQDRTTNFIPFLFLTAKITAQDEMHGLSLGADDYISKPFSGALLIARIQTILDSRKRLRKALQQNQHFTQHLSKTDSLETKAINAIYKHISEADFNIDALAKALFMSRSKLYRSLKSEMNTTASELIRRIRMKEAKKLLENNMGNVREVCCAVGYTNLSSFSRLYKETHGLSPSSN